MKIPQSPHSGACSGTLRENLAPNQHVFFPGWKSQLLGGTGLRCEGQGLKEMYEASFLQRVVGAWNSLPGEVVEADTVVAFKGRLDK